MSTGAVTRMPAQPPRAKRVRGSRQQSEEVARYFLPKDESPFEKPELGEEVASEGEALIKAFQSNSRIVYVLHAYRAEVEMQGVSPTLVKRPLPK